MYSMRFILLKVRKWIKKRYHTLNCKTLQMWRQMLIYSEFIQTFQLHDSKNDKRSQPCSRWPRQGGCELQLTYLEISKHSLSAECHVIFLQILLLKPLYSTCFYSSPETYFPKCVYVYLDIHLLSVSILWT